jgi:[ribosomal protein S5]-alanine N-acetyltransferase
MRLIGSGFTLRPFREGDEAALVRHGDHHAVWINMTNLFPHPYTPEAAASWVVRANRETEHGRDLAIDVGGEAIGALGFRRQTDLKTRTAEIGYWLGPSFWGRGIATAAMKLATPVAFAEYDFVRLQAGVLSWNPASARVLSKAGYEHEATLRRVVYKDGQVCDLLVYAKLRL